MYYSVSYLLKDFWVYSTSCQQQKQEFDLNQSNLFEFYFGTALRELLPFVSNFWLGISQELWFPMSVTITFKISVFRRFKFDISATFTFLCPSPLGYALLFCLGHEVNFRLL